MSIKMEEKYISCMVLHAVGDTVGYKNGEWEFKGGSYENIEKLYEFIDLGGVNHISLKGWLVSDDTIMHMQTADAILKDFSSMNTFGNNLKENFIEALDQFAKEGKLKKDVVNILKSKAKDYSNDYKILLKDIIYSGLQSGIIPQLVYYTDTLKWYNKHKEEIMDLLKDKMEEFGVDYPAELFGRKWEGFDPFIKETNNKNLLAWFSFEETANKIANNLGYEL